ncbi:NAD(P)H-dependent glycerol-3-phosphate dehydrogenase [Lactobacillus sp. YT155]|uniref:NAD(P)H-dependent glycerol-3-phosphate dehydrogenase n=1 Tax=Lactobacillus sp. YT155 TaxID=3060955 RepID=UPI00265DC655|nr:NAD(P)H-dependent glycerol-3-phosphate dehydrogenase [Lactobacillus sp. YT155]MDO1605114.1 NAD(P)H-dependent glycerol-3-phosphate dehydrogenase [Lactobacillus sp. YT155]
MTNVAVLGAGSWGTILANLLVENGNQVKVWGHDQACVDEINQQHTNKHYLPEFKISSELIATSDLTEACREAEMVLFVIPTQATREVAEKLTKVLIELQIKPILVTASKGLEQGSYDRISEILEDTIPEQLREAVVVLSGPSHAEDVANKDITTITAASNNLEAAKLVQDTFMNDYFRLYTNDDVVGVEMGAALKNVIAIGAGALHGLGYGDNTKAALMTRGLAEITRLGVSMGAKPLTFIGLSGVGDLIVTCTSVHSRNWRFGNAIGKGESIDETLKNMGMVVEGVATCQAAFELAEKQGIDMPITSAIYAVIYQGKDIHEVIKGLMGRSGKAEIEF